MKLRDLPISQKLALISMSAAGLALVLATAGFIVHARYAVKKRMLTELRTSAEMIGFNSAAALSFEDVGTAEQTLSALAAQPDIEGAAIFRDDGALFAQYRRPNASIQFEEPIAGDSHEFKDNRLNLYHAIVFNGERIGTIFVRSDLVTLDRMLWRSAAIGGLVALGALACAYLLAHRLRRYIAGPIAQLAGVAERVARDQDYSLRAKKEADDEVGRLMDGFNAMLAQIQTRDAALQRARDELEERVEQRTAALADAQRVATEKQAQLRFIFEAIPFSVSWVYYRPDGIEHLINPAFFRITGLPADRKLVLEDVRRISHPDDLKKQDEMRARIERGEIDSFEMEKRYLKADGGTVWAWFTLTVYRGPDGKIQQEVSTLVDITARKTADLELELLHKQLLDSSRQAGMAEVATGVLHNVGNVLNSVNVSATLVADRIRHSKAGNLSKVVALMEQHKSDLGTFFGSDPKGRMLPAYLTTLNDQLTGERSGIIEELEQLRKNIEHIKDIVAMQQSYAKTSGVHETVSVPDLVEDALRMNAGSLARHDVDLVRQYLARPVITTDKHKVMQILTNLIRNSKYACDESGRVDKQITVRTTADDTGVKISVLDNGVGIPAENLTRIFSHGFTTRKEGHGFGLHSGALAAKQLGGSLEVNSAGKGHGAEFTLQLPYKPESPS